MFEIPRERSQSKKAIDLRPGASLFRFFLCCVLPRGFLDKGETARSLLLNSLDADYKIDLLKNACIFRKAFILDGRVYATEIERYC